MPIRRLVFLVLALGLAACVRGEHEAFAYRSGLHPMHVDPAKIVATVRLPDGLVLPDEGIVLEFAGARTNSQEVMAAWYTMERGKDGYRLTAADAEALRPLQRRMRLWVSEAPDRAHARIAIHLKGCPEDSGPVADAPVLVRLSGNDGASYRTVLPGLTAERVISASDLERGGPKARPVC